jgi:membrane-associated phospholipid phosphatase
MLNKTEYYKLFIFLVIVFFIVITQYFFSDYLEKVTIPLIKILQQDPYLVKSMEWVTVLGSKKIKSFMMVFIFCICNTYHSFMYTSICYTAILLNSWLKMILQEPRPFWLDDGIVAFDCEPGYGFPSNHVLTSVPSFFIFFEILYYHFEIDRTVNAKIFYWVGIGVNTLLCFILGLSRMILGVHSLDQVFFGLLMGMGLYYFYLHVLDYDFRNYHPFLNQFSNPFQKAKMFFIFLSLYIGFLVNAMFANIQYDPIWAVRIFKACNRMPGISPYYKCIADSADYFCLIGAILGIFIDINLNYNLKQGKLPVDYIFDNISDNLLTHPDNKENRTGTWNDTDLWKGILRLFLMFTAIYVFFGISNYLSHLDQPHILTYFLVDKLLPNFLTGIFTFGFGKKISVLLLLGNNNTDKNKEKIV